MSYSIAVLKESYFRYDIIRVRNYTIPFLKQAKYNVKKSHGKDFLKFDFDSPKYINQNLKHKTEFIMKCKEYLAEKKIKNVHENNIYKHGKQQNERTT